MTNTHPNEQLQNNEELNLIQQKVDNIKKDIAEINSIISKSNNDISRLIKSVQTVDESTENLQDKLLDTKSLMKILDVDAKEYAKEIRKQFADRFEEVIDKDYVKMRNKLIAMSKDAGKRMRNDLFRQYLIGNFGEKSDKLGGVVGAALPRFARDKFNDFSANPYQFFQNMFQRRSIGGNVDPSTPYIVGENGPEVFVPSTNGNIIPNNNLEQRRNVNIVMNINTPNADSFRKSQRQIIDEALTQFKRNKM